MDVSNAFLHETLEKDVFMQQPLGFVDPQHPTHICKLNKSLYGLKQAPCQRFKFLCDALIKFDFQGSKIDTSLFYFNHHRVVLLIVLFMLMTLS